MVEKRLENEKLYSKELQNDFYIPILNQYPKNWYWIRTDSDKKNKLTNKMMMYKINVNFKYYPLHMTSLYKKNNISLTKSEELYNQIICLPIHSKLKKEDIKRICEILKRPK
jgi:dTDP-4-amino-4,6-dideoxygalactose transaminase